MISTELLSKVLNLKSTYVYSHIDKYNMLHYVAGNSECRLNVHELVHKCKEWVISKGYDILSGGLEAGLFSCYIDYADKRYTLQMKPLHHEFADTEPEAVFNACQWILEDKDKR